MPRNKPATATLEPNPTIAPAEELARAAGAGVWVNNKQISALWGSREPRRSFVYIAGLGWKQLADTSDSATTTLTMLASHAKQTGAKVNYREEADGKIHELYVW